MQEQKNEGQLVGSFAFLLGFKVKDTNDGNELSWFNNQ